MLAEMSVRLPFKAACPASCDIAPDSPGHVDIFSPRQKSTGCKVASQAPIHFPIAAVDVGNLSASQVSQMTPECQETRSR